MAPRGDQEWQQLLHELDRWVDTTGTAHVLQLTVVQLPSGQDYPLGRRAHYQREQHRKGKLSANRVAELEQRPGWSWGANRAGQHDELWQTRYQELLEHVAQHGSLTHPTDQMHDWLTQQRRKWRDDTLAKDREKLLKKVPGALEGTQSQVVTFVNAAKTWLRAGGRRRTMANLTFETTIDVDDTSYPLGRRAWYYRRRHSNPPLAGTHPLTDHEISAIEALRGWEWS